MLLLFLDRLISFLLVSYQSTFLFSETFSLIGQYTDDNRYSKQNQENTPDQNLEIDDDEDTQETSTMFQANYQYTPLKDYAASNQNGRTNTETPVVDHESKTPK